MASPNHIWAGLSSVQELATVSMISGLIDPSYYDDTLITSDMTYIPQITGRYVILCVGAGAAGYLGTSSQSGAGGGAGGCGYIETTLYAGTPYPVTIAQSNSGDVTSFGDIIHCTSGTAATSISTPGSNGTCSGGGATNIVGVLPTNGTTVKSTTVKHDSYSDKDWSIVYPSAGLGGSIGEYPNYNFSQSRSQTTLSCLVYVRSKEVSPSTGSESTRSSSYEEFSERIYGAYGTYGSGGFGSSYFTGQSWQYFYEWYGTPYLENMYSRVNDNGSYVSSLLIKNTSGAMGCVVVKLLSL